MKSGVYIIRNTINGKVYVGSAANLETRIATHRKKLRNGHHANPHLLAAWDAYGEDAFEFVIAERCDLKDVLMREQWWIDHLLATDNERGYNIAVVAGAPMRGRKHTEEWKEGQSARGTGAKRGEETKRLMREAWARRKERGWTHSEESRAKISAANAERDPATWKGRPKGYKHTPEAVAKIAEASRNRSDETKQRLSESRRNPSDETREKCSQNMKRIWAERRARKEETDPTLL